MAVAAAAVPRRVETARLLLRPLILADHANEAASAALAAGWRDLRRERIISLIRPANLPAIRLAGALGATRECTVELLGGPGSRVPAPQT